MIKHSICETDSPRNGRVDRDRWLEMLLEVRASELSGSAKNAGIAIAMHLNPETGRCESLTLEEIGERCGMDSRSCRRLIKRLEAAGWLRIKRSTGGIPNQFALITPAAAPTVGGRAHV